MQAVGIASLPLLAGCLGDEPVDDDTTDDTEDAADDSGETADDVGDDEVGDDTGDGTAESEDDTPDIRPSEIDLEPSDAWNDDHHDVEIPDEPGRAVLVVDDMRVEMVGDLTGGPRWPLYEAIIEDDEFAGDGSYFFADGLFEPTDEALEEHGWETGHQVQFRRRMVGWSGNSLSHRNSDDFVIGWPNLLEAAWYNYLEEVDGSVDARDLDGVVYVEEQFLRIDPTGVVTATGTIDSPGVSDVPEGATFEFGARAQEGWAEQLEDD
jgi:hypothetical protein